MLKFEMQSPSDQYFSFYKQSQDINHIEENFLLDLKRYHEYLHGKKSWRFST